MKGLPMGFYVVGRLMAVEDIQLPSGKRKRLSVFYGDTRLLLIYADPDVEIPPLVCYHRLLMGRVVVTLPRLLLYPLRRAISLSSLRIGPVSSRG
jgi:hypothetical protein